MKADLETLPKRREFLSRTGILALGALPAGAGFIPRSARAAGCGAKTIATGTAGAGVVAAGAVILAGGGFVAAIAGLAVMAVGSKIAMDSGVYKTCIEPKLEELKERIDKF